jgi:hypothetical protein
MTRRLVENVQSTITNGYPHKDTIDKIQSQGYMILKTLFLHDLQPDYGTSTDCITYYVKTELVEMKPPARDWFDINTDY